MEAWIHSKKRNRLGQLNVERLLRALTNLYIQEALNGPDGVDFLPWDIELVIEEPEEEAVEEKGGDEYGRESGNIKSFSRRVWQSLSCWMEFLWGNSAFMIK